MGLIAAGVLPTVPVPQGRISLTTGVAVQAATVTAGATVYYTPYRGNQVPIWDGTRFVPMSFAELSNVLANSATGQAGPAAGAAAKCYYLVVWNNAGTITLTRSPAWTSDTVVGTGAGTAQISMVQGIWTNTDAITNGPAAGYGTVVGAIRTDAGGATVSFIFGGNDTAGWAGFRNTYNREKFDLSSKDTNADYAYSTATWRQMRGSANNQCSFIRDLDEGGVSASLTTNAYGTATVSANIGINLDSTTAAPNPSGQFVLQVVNLRIQPTLFYAPTTPPGIGFHYLAAMEYASGATVNWSPNTQAGLTVSLWA